MLEQPLSPRFEITSGSERRGGTATVYRATDTDQGGRAVAIKVFDQVRHRAYHSSFFQRERSILAETNHPNIVPLVTSGFDPERQAYYLVLEWMDQKLSEYVEAASIRAWDQFSRVAFRPLLHALAYAHARGACHRDIKPANILVNSEGIPKLADFNTAKVTSVLHGIDNLDHFVTDAYAPPERPLDKRSDVFMFGVAMLECFRPGTRSNPPDPKTMIASAGLPPHIEVFFRRLTATAPQERFVDAVDALAELSRMPIDGVRDIACYVQIPSHRRVEIAGRLNCHPRDLDEVFRRDLFGTAAIGVPRRDMDHETYELLGREYIYNLVLNDNTIRSSFVITRVQRPLWPAVIEEARSRALAIPGEIVLSSPPSATRGADYVASLLAALNTFVADQAGRRQAAQVQELFRLWQRVLDAKRTAEGIRQQHLPYRGRTVNGRRVTFKLSEPPVSDIEGQTRSVKVRQGGFIRGIVEKVTDDALVLRVEAGDASRTPIAGTIVTEAGPTERSLTRQQQALQDVRHRRSVNPNLVSLLACPELCSLPREVGQVHLFQTELDSAKQDALRIALGSQDITAVEGPPGTGKSTLIAEIICQYLTRHPGSKILLTSQTHIAVDNALEKAIAIRRRAGAELAAIRVGRDEKISNRLEKYRTDEIFLAWQQSVEARSREFLRQWAAARHVPPATVELGSTAQRLRLVLEETCQCRLKREELAAGLERLDQDRRETERFAATVRTATVELEAMARGTARAVASSKALSDAVTTYLELGHQLREVLQRQANNQAERDSLDDALVSLDENQLALSAEEDTLRKQVGLALGDPILAQGPIEGIEDAAREVEESSAETLAQLSAIQKLQEDWFQSFGRRYDFDDVLLAQQQVVAGTCLGFASIGSRDSVEYDLVIIDEASKATPTEALVPMSRGRTWVLLGDPKQLPPFVDDELRRQKILDRFELSDEDIAATLFNHLLHGLPKLSRPFLSVQHRMIKGIGDLVSHCFYGDELKTGRTEDRKLPVRVLFPKPVLWLSTSRLSGRRETPASRSDTGAPSFINVVEARIAREWLTKLNTQARVINAGSDVKKRITVAVLCGYFTQREELRRVIVPTNRHEWTDLDIEINTVDAFQGRDADVAIYSVTRSNPEGKLGFVADIERLNVALSRGRDALIIIGDAKHCLQADRRLAFDKVLSHINQAQGECELVELS